MAERCPTCGAPVTERFANIIRIAAEGRPTPERLAALEAVATAAEKCAKEPHRLDLSKPTSLVERELCSAVLNLRSVSNG